MQACPCTPQKYYPCVEALSRLFGQLTATGVGMRQRSSCVYVSPDLALWQGCLVAPEFWSAPMMMESNLRLILCAELTKRAPLCCCSVAHHGGGSANGRFRFWFTLGPVSRRHTLWIQNGPFMAA